VRLSAREWRSPGSPYAQPELPCEATDPDYRRFLPGLGLTRVNVLPHYQLVKDEVLDGLRVFEDVTYPDSFGRCFYALPDGSFLYLRDGKTELRGEAWRIAEGRLEKVCENGGVLALKDE
jgi:dipeptidase E